MKVEIIYEPIQPVKPPVKQVTITLEPDEAMKLAKLCGKFVGDGTDLKISSYLGLSNHTIEVGTRKIVDDIWKELVDNGFDYTQSI